MNIVACDYCKKVDGVLVEAADMIPAFVMMVSKRRMNEIGLCEKHQGLLFPEALKVNVTPIRQKHEKRERVEQVARGNGHEAISAGQLKRQEKARKLPEIAPDGSEFFTARQLAGVISRPYKSMSYVLRKVKPVGKDPQGSHPFVYSRDQLVRNGVLS